MKRVKFPVDNRLYEIEGFSSIGMWSQHTVLYLNNKDLEMPTDNNFLRLMAYLATSDDVISRFSNLHIFSA